MTPAEVRERLEILEGARVREVQPHPAEPIARFIVEWDITDEQPNLG